MDPFRVEGPACISFSGGRTSAYMLRRILDAHGGALPPDVHVLFANTGKERDETLDFVHEVETRWGVHVRWIELYIFSWAVMYEEPETRLAEMRVSDDGTKVRLAFQHVTPSIRPMLCHAYREVDYKTASRGGGAPFEAMIRARSFLPNPVMRICTQELKIRPMKKFAMIELGFEHWTNVIGLRADEPRRVAKTLAPTAERWENTTPLATAGVTVQDVAAFWAAQPFDLHLRTHEGNCTLCFLKGRGKIERIMRARPDLATWWIEQESIGLGAQGDMRFRHDRPSYAQMLEGVQRKPMLPGLGLVEDDRRPYSTMKRRMPLLDEVDIEDEEDDDDALPCACTD